MNYLIYKSNILIAQTDNKNMKDIYKQQMKDYGVKIKIEKYDRLPVSLMNTREFKKIELNVFESDFVCTVQEMEEIDQFIELTISEDVIAMQELQLSIATVRMTHDERELYDKTIDSLDRMIVDVTDEDIGFIHIPSYFNLHTILKYKHTKDINQH